MKKSFFKVGGHFLPITSPALVTFTRFLACTFRKVLSTSALKRFYRDSYIFGIIIYLLMDKQFPWLVLKHIYKYNSWGLNGTKYWRLFIIEYLQLNKLKQTFQSYILSFLIFFAEEQYMKRPVNVCTKGQRIAGALSRVSI